MIDRNYEKTALVVTSIAPPNEALRLLAAGASARGMDFFLVGDASSPGDFDLAGCDFYDLNRQATTGLKTAGLVPQRQYARKNIGYLLAARAGAEIIIETDDDNLPRDGFWAPRVRTQRAAHVRECGWMNVYGYFSEVQIWPRGLPLDRIHAPLKRFEDLPVEPADCPIQQGLADGDPDVDAVYRLVLPLPQSFRADRRVALGVGAWCPYNSQNTTTWRDAFPLLYLPSYCSFRMTDIWRSLIGQRIAWENGWSILFHEATVWQERNQHDLMTDFRGEIPGYLHNAAIAEVLERVPVRPGPGQLGESLLACYEALVSASILEAREIPLVEAWLEDLKNHSLQSRL
jgi:hypothetical protein